MKQTTLFGGTENLNKVAEEVKNCTKCRLHKSRRNAVPGEGDHNADIVFIGEGPGKNEDEQGRPFVGRAGELLTELLESVDLSRDEVFITNVVKCRPPDNRDPKADEKKSCRPYLERQLKLIGPKVIGTLGNHATKSLVDETGITSIHGEEFEYKEITVIPLYHPAAGLYNPNLVEDMKEDIKKLKNY